MASNPSPLPLQVGTKTLRTTAGQASTGDRHLRGKPSLLLHEPAPAGTHFAPGYPSRSSTLLTLAWLVRIDEGAVMHASKSGGEEMEDHAGTSGAHLDKTDYQDLTEVISRHAREIPDKVFLRSVDQGKQLTFGELERYCALISTYFRAQGFGAGDKISVIGWNSIEALLVYYGTLYHGAVINPINAEESPENIYKILRLVRPALVVFDKDMLLNIDRLSGSQWMVFSDFEVPSGGDKDFFSALPERPSQVPPSTRDEMNLAEVVFTSGTTSTPKGVCIARGPLHSMAAEAAERVGIKSEDVILEYRNYNWASAQLLSILSAVLTGATLILARKFSRSRFPSWLAQNGVTVAAGVPTVINILAHEPVAISNGRLGRLRLMTSSSAPLSVAIQREFERLYGIPILQMMGMTEAGFMLGNPFEGRKTGSAGTPCKHKDVLFLNQEGERCGPGEEGEMIVRGYSVGIGYLQEDGGIDPFPPSGIRTGDLGYMDRDGFVFITGRMKDLIIRGGVNIAPAEITARLMEHSSVKDAATIGVPDPIYGEEVASFVVAKGGETIGEEDMILHCRRTLPEFKVPKRIYMLDAIPKTPRGKVSKEALFKVLKGHVIQTGTPSRAP